MKFTFNSILKCLAIACTICFLLLINPKDLSLATNLPVYIGLTSSILLLANTIIAERNAKKKQKK